MGSHKSNREPSRKPPHKGISKPAVPKPATRKPIRKKAALGAAANRDANPEMAQSSSSPRVNDDLPAVFKQQIDKARELGLGKSGKQGVMSLNVATLCSGTEAPLLSYNALQEAYRAQGLGEIIKFKHVFSCEIEPFKQAYIRRNTDTPLIFRDVGEVGNLNDEKA